MMNMMAAGESLANPTEVPGGYLRIGDMAKRFGVTLRALRFYEDKGLLSPVREGNTRLYTQREVTRLELILFGRKVGFSLREIKQMMDLHDPSGANTRQLKLAVEKSERQLVKLEKQRAAVDEAIAELKSAIESWREALSARQSIAASA